MNAVGRNEGENEKRWNSICMKMGEKLCVLGYLLLLLLIKGSLFFVRVCLDEQKPDMKV